MEKPSSTMQASMLALFSGLKAFIRQTLQQNFRNDQKTIASHFNAIIIQVSGI
jgi:tRNA A37 threonylcarbamoyltransferase TsaD